MFFCERTLRPIFVGDGIGLTFNIFEKKTKKIAVGCSEFWKSISPLLLLTCVVFSVAGLDLDGILPTSIEMDCSSSDFMLNYVEAVRKMGDEEAQQVNVKYLKTKHELSDNFQQYSPERF